MIKCISTYIYAHNQLYIFSLSGNFFLFILHVERVCIVTRTEIPLKRRLHLYILGAFLIPFFVMLILEGVPLFLIELGLGQRMRQGALGVWNNIHPWLGGIGIASCIVTFFVALYYNVIITWCFYYLFNSLRVSRSIKFVTSNFTTYRRNRMFRTVFL